MHQRKSSDLGDIERGCLKQKIVKFGVLYLKILKSTMGSVTKITRKNEIKNKKTGIFADYSLSVWAEF